MNLEETIHNTAEQTRIASQRVAELSSAQKDAWLAKAADQLEADREHILDANAQDMREAEAKDIAAPLIARLELTDDKWRVMIAGLRDIVNLPDPVGRIERTVVRPNGLEVGRMRIPLGVIAIIYESRPSVTVDAAALCVKSGNAVILRGGSEALRSNLALAEALRTAARETDVPENAISIISVTDREAIDHLLREERNIDLVIPRGGPGLIRKVTETSRIPVIKHDAGVCHIFLDASADAEMATRIVLDSKLRQMAMCNGVETLLVHRDAERSAMPVVLKALHEAGVEIRGDERSCEIFGNAKPAKGEDWAAEYLAPILAVRIVDNMDGAIDHIRRYGTNHTDVIVTSEYASAQEWLRRVGSSTVGVNCSTAFSDGYRLGLGAEIGVSTSKLHAYGPMGLEELTTLKFVLRGDGQLRE